MHSILTSRQARLYSIGSTLLLGGALFSACAVGRVLDDDISTRAFWLLWAGVQALSLFGYLASSLPAWARWHDGTAEERLTLISSALSALLTGNVIYYGGYYYYDMSKVVCLIAAVGGGFLGEKILNPIFSKIFAQVKP